MTVRMRMQRFGRKHKPFYRIVAAFHRKPRDGAFLEILGTYDPLPDKQGNKHVTLNVERAKHWLMNGADPSETVAFLLGRAGVIPMFPRRGAPRSAVADAVMGGGGEVTDAADLEGGEVIDAADLEGEIAVSETDEVSEEPDTAPRSK